MARYVFNLPTVQATQTVRLDTALGSDSPASGLLAADGTPISSMLTADHIGFLPEVQGPDGVATLYVKVLAYGGAVTGTPVAVTGLSQQAAPAPTGGSSPVGVGDFASVGSYSQGPVTVSATDTQTSFVSALIASDPAGSIYSTSNAGAMPTGWALVDDGSGGLRNVTAPKGVYYVTLWLQWDATTTGWRGVELRTNVERARDSRSGADPLVVSGSWHVSTVAVVANDGDNVLRDLDGVFTYVQSTVAGVTVAFAELDIRKIG